MKRKAMIIFLLASANAFGQDIKTTDFFDKAKQFDFSDLLTLDKFQIENGTETVKRSQPLGFISENYQRFYIHFSSVIQNPDDPYQYFVYGKTRVKNNICEFQGTLTITAARTYDVGDVANLKQGFIQGEYSFFEDRDQAGSGMLKGHFQTDFYIDPENKAKYDALAFGADGFKNNQFEGLWISYKSGASKTCNWGDYRIPDSDDLDIGAGEFGTAEKFDQFGWLSLSAAHGGSHKMNQQEAMKMENHAWWKE